ncbi:MAG: ABC transporter ATP-binding protein [Epsilonproteobacteria bacterium]|nr:ABC transporter ATP-binding protein [Campylobacterota bacterium]
MLDVKNLSVNYDGISALKGVSLNIIKGTLVSIIGANGAGKSTLMKAISGLVKYRGTISYNDNEIKHLNTSAIVKSGIVSIPEGRQLFKTMSVKDNIMLGAYLRYRRKDEVQESYRWVCSLFPIINSRSEQIAGTLSGGEQQMIAIARGLMSKPKLLLLDEPSLGLAPLFIKSLFQTIELLKSEGITILLVEQNARMALSIADYCYLLTTGNVTFEGKPSEIMNNEKIKEAYLG